MHYGINVLDKCYNNNMKHKKMSFDYVVKSDLGRFCELLVFKGCGAILWLLIKALLEL